MNFSRNLPIPARIGAVALPIVYLGALAASLGGSAWAPLAAGAVLAGAVEVLRRFGLPDHGALLLAWAPLHLLILATGALASPGLPLAAAWVVALGLAWPGSALPAAITAAALLVVTDVAATGAVEAGEGIRAALLLALASAAPRFLAPPNHSSRPAAEPGPQRRARPPAIPDTTPSGIQGLLDLVRLAASAEDATFWTPDPRRSTFQPRATSSAQGWVAAAPVEAGPEHPFAWALAQNQPVHLARGRNPLPREAAREMLLIPVAGGTALLTLDFATAAPAGAEAAAFAGGKTLSALPDLLPEPGVDDAGTPRDALTDLPDREAFLARLSAVSALFQRYARPFSIIMLDVDHFKRVNDTWGHAAGDRVLQHVAVLVRASIREVDLAARFSGEEFAILLPETNLAQALTVAERIRQAVEVEPLTWNGQQVVVTASFGVATCPDSCAVATETLSDAETALFNSKRSGRNRVSASTPRA